MAIDYTVLFTDIGKMLKYLNVYLGYSSTSLASDFSAIATVLTASSRYDILSGLPEQYNGFRDAAAGWSGSLAARIESRINHFSTVVSQLPVPSQYSIQDVLTELFRDMVTNVQTVKRSTVTLGSSTAAPGNIGDATVLTSKVLDGYSAPKSGYPVNRKYLGLDSELGVTAETMTLTCTADSKSGSTEGREAFSWVGGVAPVSLFDWRSEGSGVGPAVTVGNGRGLLQNGEMETWTVTNTPDSWTLAAGVLAGTHIFRESSSIKRGTYACKLLGNGALDPIKISQAFAISSLNPGRSYCVACWVKGDSGIAGSSALTIQFEGTGYTAGAAEKISLNQAALAALTSYGLKYFFVNIPVNIPSDFTLVIKATGPLTNAKPIYIDGMMLVETAWHGGVGVAIAAGAIPIIKGDRFTFTVANNNTGVFQTLMRKKFGVQLPSDASPSISDTLAT